MMIDQSIPNTTSGHNWSGWPGAFCSRCGATQALEEALADERTKFVGEGDNMDLVWEREADRLDAEDRDSHCDADNV